PGDALLRRSTEAVKTFLRDDALKSELRQEPDELCLRQSARDSTGPEIDVPSDRFRQLVRDDDVAIQELTAWLQDTEHLTERLSLVGRKVQHSVRDHVVHAVRLHWQRQRVAKTNLDVVESDPMGSDPSTVGHRFGHID